jgi:hypothetical protein
MANVTITTNRVPRHLIALCELTEVEQALFDYYIDAEESSTPRIFRYRGSLYDVHEFMRVTSGDLKGWDGYHSETFFSGVVIKLVNDGDEVVVGSYCS